MKTTDTIMRKTARASLSFLEMNMISWSIVAGGLLMAGSAVADPCFTVEGTKVTVQQLFKGDAKPHVIDLEDLPSVSHMISRNSESHNFIFMNIKRDAAKQNVLSFSVQVDDRKLEYPQTQCPKK